MLPYVSDAEADPKRLRYDSGVSHFVTCVSISVSIFKSAILEEPVQERDRDSGFVDIVGVPLPAAGRSLARHERRAGSVAILYDLQKVVPLALSQRLKREVIEDQKIDPA